MRGIRVSWLLIGRIDLIRRCGVPSLHKSEAPTLSGMSECILPLLWLIVVGIKKTIINVVVKEILEEAFVIEVDFLESQHGVRI